ncbi:MAG: hypothetical protein F6K47_24135 [Symploca sp. SIO2E6]|nr:hypothetical protein [Symploca sp. SIO2E6]
MELKFYRLDFTWSWMSFLNKVYKNTQLVISHWSLVIGTNNKQQTTNNKQQTTNNKQQIQATSCF